MKTYARFIPAALVLTTIALLPLMAAAVVPTVGTPPVLMPVTIDVSTGDQFDPHISGDWVAYTDDVAIRYYNFATQSDLLIPSGAARDLLSDVSGSRIVFSRVTVGFGTAVMLYDAATASAPIAIGPSVANPTRIGAAIGGNTVAYIDFGLQASGELVIVDLTTAIATRITNDAEIDTNAAVSPDGNVVVWEHCAASFVNCDIWQAVKTGTNWIPSVVAATASPEGNPDTNGLPSANGQNGQIVYDSQRGSNSDIFWHPVGIGAETQLELPGLEGNPSISGQFIAFESRVSLVDAAADLYVYDMVSNVVYQITNTPLVNEQLNDITLLPNAQCTTPGAYCLRMVWASDEDGWVDQRNIRGATFELPDSVAPTLTVPSTITVYAPTLAGAVVNYSVTASDDLTPNPIVGCVPASGSTFPIGTTSVNCSASDSAGNTATASFNVIVLSDLIPPVLLVPPTIHAMATSPAGAIVNYVVTATDNVTPHPVVTCSPVSGSTFAIGTTGVGCRATDLSGNSVTRSFNVIVEGASVACQSLDAFIAQVKALVGHGLTNAQATQLITWAKQLKGNLGCPY